MKKYIFMFGFLFSLSVFANITVKNYKSDQIDRLEVENISGNIHVKATENAKSKVTIESIKVSKNCILEIGLNNKLLKIKVNATKIGVTSFFSWLRGNSQECKINFLVEVPAKTKSTLKVVSGDLKMENMNGDTNLTTTSGDVDFNGGKIENIISNSVSGNVKFHGDFTNLNLQTVSGEVEVKGESLHNVKVKTISGDVKLSGSKIDDIDLKSVSGSAEIVYVKKGKKINLNFETISGDIDIIVPKETKIAKNLFKTRGDVYIREVSGDSTVFIRGKTISGEVRLQKTN